MEAITENEMHPKQFMALALDGQVAYAKRRYVRESDDELEPGTVVVLAGDHSPMKRDDPASVACPVCGASAGTACSEQPMYDEGSSVYHRERRRSAPVLVEAHTVGTVIGHELHPYPGYPRKHMVRMPNGTVLSCDTADLTAQ